MRFTLAISHKVAATALAGVAVAGPLGYKAFRRSHAPSVQAPSPSIPAEVAEAQEAPPSLPAVVPDPVEPVDTSSAVEQPEPETVEPASDDGSADAGLATQSAVGQSSDPSTDAQTAPPIDPTSSQSGRPSGSGKGGGGGGTNPPPAPPPPTCTYPGGFSFVTGPVMVPFLSLAKPVRGVPLMDPSFSTCIVRLTDHVKDNTGGYARNDYSRRQAYNADDTLVVINGDHGYWHLYDAVTYKYIKRLNYLAGDSEPQWHPTNPQLLYFLPTNGGLELDELNVVTNLMRRVADFRGRLPWPTAAHCWTRSEGSPSSDARYWAFMCDDASWNSLGIFTWDMQSDAILGTLDTEGNRPDHVSMSPSGKYVVAQWWPPWRTRSYDQNLKSFRIADCTMNHEDLVIGADGDDYYVSVDASDGGDPACSPANGYVFMRNLRTGVRTDLFPTYVGGTVTYYHFSGKGFRKPGWFLMSNYATEGSGPLQWLDEKILAVQLAAKPIVYQLGFHRRAKLGASYYNQPHGSANRSFTRVIFNSNWGSASDDVDAYVIELPPWH